LSIVEAFLPFSLTDCEAAADTFVARYPAFDWRARPNSGAVEAPVIRSYVECVPAASD
jgi:hypothetical protein